jgi:hypothetical protein
MREGAAALVLGLCMAALLADVFAAAFFVDGFAETFVETLLTVSLLAAAALAVTARAAAVFLVLESAGSGGRLETFALGLRAPGFACLVSDDFMVFLTDAITSALPFCPALETGPLIDGEQTLRRSETLQFGPGKARSGAPKR